MYSIGKEEKSTCEGKEKTKRKTPNVKRKRRKCVSMYRSSIHSNTNDFLQSHRKNLSAKDFSVFFHIFLFFSHHVVNILIMEMKHDSAPCNIKTCSLVTQNMSQGNFKVISLPFFMFCIIKYENSQFAVVFVLTSVYR